MKIEREIKWSKIESVKELYKRVPDTIERLYKDYHFYWCGTYITISKDILDVVGRQKKEHNITLYIDNKYENDYRSIYLVIYCKNQIQINYFHGNISFSQVKYCVKKAQKRVLAIKEDYEF